MTRNDLATYLAEITIHIEDHPKDMPLVLRFIRKTMEEDLFRDFLEVLGKQVEKFKVLSGR